MTLNLLMTGILWTLPHQMNWSKDKKNPMLLTLFITWKQGENELSEAHEWIIVSPITLAHSMLRITNYSHGVWTLASRLNRVQNIKWQDSTQQIRQFSSMTFKHLPQGWIQGAANGLTSSITDSNVDLNERMRNAGRCHSDWESERCRVVCCLLSSRQDDNFR